MRPIAVLYQQIVPPPVNGIHKPLKPNGYRDSGADVAFALRTAGIPVVTPLNRPDAQRDADWVFGDTLASMQEALKLGAQRLWANTVLFAAHPIGLLAAQGIGVVGQPLAATERHDDKGATNHALSAAGLPVVPSLYVGLQPGPQSLALDDLCEEDLASAGLSLPCMIKPLRGRGSQGVSRANTLDEIRAAAQMLLTESTTGPRGEAALVYGDLVMIEPFLPGDEITITVMPPGTYDDVGTVSDPWCLPPVRRFNHVAGVVPYNGTVAVSENSVALSCQESSASEWVKVRSACVGAARHVGALMPIRIDCRADALGNQWLFDLNMKPNITGPGRPGRDDQDSLVSMAARSFGWSFPQFLRNVLQNFP